MARAESVDITKAKCKANAFHFFHSAAKSCLFPFLSIYLRQLGLTALQTGVIIACQAWAYMLFGPFWTRCAFGCNKKKFVLVFSLLALISSFLLMTIIPSSQKNADLSCSKPGNIINGTLNIPSNVTDLNTEVDISNVPVKTTPGSKEGKEEKIPLETLQAYFQKLSPEDRENLRSSGITPESLQDFPKEKLMKMLAGYMASTKEQLGPVETTTTPPAADTTETTTAVTEGTLQGESTDPAMVFYNKEAPQVKEYLKKWHDITAETFRGWSVERTADYIKNQIKNDELAQGVTPKDEKSHGQAPDAAMELYQELLQKAPQDLKQYLEQDQRLTAEHFRDWTVADTETFLRKIINHHTEQQDGRHRRAIEHEADKDSDTAQDNSSAEGNRTFDAAETVSKDDVFVTTMDSFTKQLRAFSAKLGHLKEEVFLAVLLLVVVGGVFSAPTERVADSMWFEFLDGMDRLEMFGGHRVAAAVGVLIFPIAVTFAVENTPCFLPLHQHHILLHFYSFTLLVAVAFVLAFFFPVYSGSRKILRSSRLCKGLRILCSDKHAAMFAMSAIVAGMTHGLLTTFLFWQVQDHGGSEIYMGGAVAIAAAGDLVVQLIQKAMIRRLTNAGTTLLGLFILGLRLVVYSFMWRPYVVLAGEAFRALSHTLIMVSTETYQDFRLNPLAMDRSASAALTFVYQGFGVGVGAVVAGALYDVVGVSVVFQGACVGTIIWSILFAILQRCFRKPSKVRYTKLLQEEDVDLSDESDVAYEDDWLEVAMKHHK